jgi:dihydroorotate dehydrogenase (fumarate)/dihydroorotate dehydrogenase
MPDLYRDILRPVLFRLDPETAHQLAKPILGSRRASRWLGDGPFADSRLATSLGDLRLSNPVGLAPGFDKNAEMVEGLSRLGFGYVTLGTVLPDHRRGNPRPRIVRRPPQRAMVNSMGLPCHGLEPFARRLERLRAFGAGPPVPIIASIGALDEDGYLRVMCRVQPLVDAVEINLRCNNNVDETGDFLNPDVFERLMRRVMAERRVPVHVKVTEWNDEAEHRDRIEIVERSLALGVEAFSTSSVLREDDPGLSMGRGNLTGAPLLERTIAAVRELRGIVGDRAAVRARGGISSGTDALRALQAGATTVEIFTAFIYGGWNVARGINEQLLEVMDDKRPVPH